MNKNSKVLICGLNKILNESFILYFTRLGFTNIRDSNEISLDLLSQAVVKNYFNDYRPGVVIFTGSVSGGIIANIEHPAEFMHSNIVSQTIVLNSAKEINVESLIFFASSCVYPENAQQPLKEEYLLSGELEETSAAYALAKISGIKMCAAYNKQYGTDFIAVIPATIYGPGDDFNLDSSHVISALIKKFDEAKNKEDDKVEVWGSGNPRREFIFVDDLVEACFFLLNNYNEKSHINVGSSRDYSIAELAGIVSKVVGFKGKIEYNTDKPDGVRQKLLDSRRIIALGWRPKVSLQEGIAITYDWFKKHRESILGQK